MCAVGIVEGIRYEKWRKIAVMRGGRLSDPRISNPRSPLGDPIFHRPRGWGMNPQSRFVYWHREALPSRTAECVYFRHPLKLAVGGGLPPQGTVHAPTGIRRRTQVPRVSPTKGWRKVPVTLRPRFPEVTGSSRHSPLGDPTFRGGNGEISTHDPV